MKLIKVIKPDIYLVAHDFRGIATEEVFSLSGLKNAVETTEKKEMQNFYLKVIDVILESQKPKEVKNVKANKPK